MTDTSGPSSMILSASAALQSALASRLAASLPSPGGMSYRTTFKHRATPSQQQIPAWRSTAARTSGSDFTGWQTPRSHISSDTIETHEARQARVVERHGRRMGTPIEVQAQMAGWPTPRQADGEKNVRSAAGSASEMERKGGPQDMSMAVSLCGWSTPTSRDHKDGAPCPNVPINGLLGRTVWLSGWPTPNSRENGGGDYSDPAKAMKRLTSGHQINLSEVALFPGPIRYTVHGEMLTGSSARMASGGQLNPALPRWLMAFPAEWERSAPGWSSWSIWQDVMHAALEMQSDTESEA